MLSEDTITLDALRTSYVLKDDKEAEFPVQHPAAMESALIKKSSGCNRLNDIYYEFVLLIVTGIVTLAPLSLPVINREVVKLVLAPNKVLTVVAVKLIVVPITV